ncbi:MAG: hypothetical protein OEL19_06755 [Sulfurimonas sp.]|nr:hypothetical protein [Sulfurimonas sp.]
MRLSDIGRNATAEQRVEQAEIFIDTQKLFNEAILSWAKERNKIKEAESYISRCLREYAQRIHLLKNHSLKSKIKILYISQITKKIKSLVVDAIFYKVILFFQDTRFIDKNILLQNTYYKTITSRP